MSAPQKQEEPSYFKPRRRTLLEKVFGPRLIRVGKPERLPASDEAFKRIVGRK